MKLYLDKTFPQIYEALNNVSEISKQVSNEVGLDPTTVELALIRASQLNQCATCLSVHIPRALQAGLPQQKIDLLPSWREARDTYSDEDRAAIELAETITLLPPREKNSKAAQRAAEVFSREQVAALEWSIILINAYNRISIMSEHPVRKAR
ncbi:carboxymuconolactone decarboxylase family protein [Arcanobacterium bovis]|uniref:Carboxymuconolactone decarboxylase family protein n=1 Tax=Arcanobacterium bovis TaxID=2529275 RepID=A0A4Q9UYZ8_9ACTO|nr:carboxymuconolactone decarboxylase family protein [Arcanobacterium bovis]TBW20847.1 carboxymuconolactone decarboxylase family protein [Arcanobacterium bovis]